MRTSKRSTIVIMTMLLFLTSFISPWYSSHTIHETPEGDLHVTYNLYIHKDEVTHLDDNSSSSEVIEIKEYSKASDLYRTTFTVFVIFLLWIFSSIVQIFSIVGGLRKTVRRLAFINIIMSVCAPLIFYKGISSVELYENFWMESSGPNIGWYCAVLLIPFQSILFIMIWSHFRSKGTLGTVEQQQATPVEVIPSTLGPTSPLSQQPVDCIKCGRTFPPEEGRLNIVCPVCRSK